MLIVPLDKIAVTPIFESDKKGSLWIPDIAKERCDQGIVKYVGDNVKGIVPGEYVLFSGYSGTLIAMEGEGTLIVLRAMDVRAKILPLNTAIPGLYYKVTKVQGENGGLFIEPREFEYVEANYEDVSNLIADAYQNTDFFRNTRIKNKLEDRDSWVKAGAEMREKINNQSNDNAY